MPIECVAALFFAVIALMFVGLGQAMGRAFASAPDRVAAYSVDILGSLAGIVCFTLVSYYQTSPVVWFAIGLAAVFRALPKVSRPQLYGLLASDGLAGYRGDARRRQVPDLLVALLQGHVPSP